MKSFSTDDAILPTYTVVCCFSTGVTVGIIGLTIGGIMGRTPGTPGIGGRDIAGSMPIAPGKRGGYGGRTIGVYGDG